MFQNGGSISVFNLPKAILLDSLRLGTSHNGERRRQLDKEGTFIVIEGPEGGGKTSIATWLGDLLTEQGIDVTHGREPGGTAIGEVMRSTVLDPNLDPCERTTLFLMLTARSAFVERLVKPALNNGDVFISDRFDLSTMAYQIEAGGLPEEETILLNNFAKDYVRPDLYIVLSVSPEVGFQRKAEEDEERDRIEMKELDFHRKVARGYRKFGERLDNAVIINTDNKSLSEVKEVVISELRSRLNFDL